MAAYQDQNQKYGGYPQGQGYPQPSCPPYPGYTQQGYPQPGYPSQPGGFQPNYVGAWGYAGHQGYGPPNNFFGEDAEVRGFKVNDQSVRIQKPGYAPTNINFGEEAGVKEFTFNNQSIRKALVRKLLMTLSIVALLLLFHTPTRDLVARNPTIWWVSLGIMLVALISMACCPSVRCQAPMNFIFLGLFTAVQNLMFACIDSNFYSQNIENEIDRRGEAGLVQPILNDLNRFGLNGQQQNIQPLLISPTQNQPVFHQRPFPPQHSTFVSQPTINTPHIFGDNTPVHTNLQSNVGLNNSYPSLFNQNLSPLVQNNFTPEHFQQHLQTTLVDSSLTQNRNHNNQFSTTVQRPNSTAFLSTSPTQQNIYNQPDLIKINQALNMASVPQTESINLNKTDAHTSFQPNLGSNPMFTNGQSRHTQMLFRQQNKEKLEKLKDQNEREKIIQKHKEFVDRQKQLHQDKAEKAHDGVSKQAKKQDRCSQTESCDYLLRRNQDKLRTLYPYEADLLRKAVQMYDEVHPTTITTTTTTTTTPTQNGSTFRRRPKHKLRTSLPDKQKLDKENKSLLELSEKSGNNERTRAKSEVILQKPDYLKQLKLTNTENLDDFNESNFSTREIFLPHSQNIKVITKTNTNFIPNAAITTDGNALPHIITPSPSTIRQKKLSVNVLIKDTLSSPEADIGLIRQFGCGKLEEVNKSDLQNEKKVMSAFLKEQNDSCKAKGAKAKKQQMKDRFKFENILIRIKKAKIHLPSSKNITVLYDSTTASPASEISAASSEFPSIFFSPVNSNNGSSGDTNLVRCATTTAPTISIYRQSPTDSTVDLEKTYTTKSTTKPCINYDFENIKSIPMIERPSIESTQNLYIATRNRFESTKNFANSATPGPALPIPPSFRPTAPPLILVDSSTAGPEEAGSNVNYTRESYPGLVDILEENGLFATAKYLRQSGLDSILNETGPYTILAPTDNAFRTILMQLGEPDNAEDKFKENPRLLIDLLLHHIIPGVLDIASLQDEMTGVSLAGTQLRVNQYDMHDVEWNEIKVTTINGARVVDEKDIIIPQGIAHAVDRVMFPLPIRDLVQTLQADRDRRFITFLKTLYASEFSDILSESKTYTVFAPTELAFDRLSGPDMAKLTEREAARAFVARHVLPGTLYSAEMRYYQLRNSMKDSKPLTLQKNDGCIKVNNAPVVRHNIPATNGFIHAIDNILS